MIKYFTYFLPIFIFITDFISKCLAALLVIVTSKWLDVQPTFLMVFIPFLLIISNDWKRISFAKKGISKVKRMLDNSGELEEYNQKMDVITEYAHLFGDLSGILFGSIFILGKVPLI